MLILSGGQTLNHLMDMIDKKVVRVCRGGLPNIRITDCFIQRALLPKVIHQELNEASFFIAHGDLSAQNIIVDSQYNVTG